jgi:hypothetical protein
MRQCHRHAVGAPAARIDVCEVGDASHRRQLSEGALQINNAIQSLPIERTQGLRVATLGCPIAENVAGVGYHQYLGLFDALGQLNAWGHWPEYWPPTWHSTNPALPPAMAVGEMTSTSIRD